MYKQYALITNASAVINYELRITNYELRITNYELRITNPTVVILGTFAFCGVECKLLTISSTSNCKSA
jgi:hypothetical protein